MKNRSDIGTEGDLRSRHAVCAAAMLRAGVVALGLLTLSVGPVRAECADLAIVLAIDASGSVDPPEFLLQQQGYARAFRAQKVQSALAAAGVVDVAVVLWGDTEVAPQVLPWQRLEDTADTEQLAGRIAGMPRIVFGNTGIGQGVATAIDLLEDPERCAWRKIVNVSGDGVESVTPRRSSFVPLRITQARADPAGITINALAIETDEQHLSDWYRDHLIAGPGAFVMEVRGFETFAAAIVEKLAREIAPPMVAALLPPVGPGRIQN